MYSFQSRVRYSEITKNGYMDLSSIINYFQDCSTFQSEDVGVGMDYLQERNQAWLLSSWQIIVNRYPKLGENIKIGTWPYDFKSMYGFRNFIIYDENDAVVSIANSIWVLIDTKTGRPQKVLPEYVEAYGHGEPFPMEYADRKITLPETLCSESPFQVVKANIDTNNHVNNCQYIQMAEEYLPESFTIYQMRADYRRSALLGDTILPMVSCKDNTCTVVLADTSEKPYAIIEFMKRKES